MIPLTGTRNGIGEIIFPIALLVRTVFPRMLRTCRLIIQLMPLLVSVKVAVSLLIRGTGLAVHRLKAHIIDQYGVVFMDMHAVEHPVIGGSRKIAKGHVAGGF